MMTRKEMTDICCMELSACADSIDMRSTYRRCAGIAQNRGCSDRVFADAWQNAVQWFSLSMKSGMTAADHVA